MRLRMITVVAMVAVSGLGVAGCAGSTPAPAASSPASSPAPASAGPAAPVPGPLTPRKFPEPLPPPAEPGAAPVPAVAPPGRVVAVGGSPEGIVANPVTRTVAVGVRNPNQLTLLGADTATVTGRVPLPGVLRHLQLAGPGGPVLVPDESSNSLLRVSLPAGPVTSQVLTGISPHDATQAPNGTVFVANEAGGTVVALRGNQVAKTFTDVTQPAGLAPVGNVVGLLDVRENTLTFYDSTTLAGIAELPAGAGPTHLIADKHGRMIATDTRGGALLVYDPTGTPRQLARVAVPGQPYGITYDPVRDRLWVSATGLNQVVGFDMTQPVPREVARIPTVRQANTVAVDPGTGRLFVTGTDDGTVQAINP